MPVRFIPFGGTPHTRVSVDSNHLQRFTNLLGQPFPNEEVEALWSMVPGQWYVEWYHNLSIFGVRRQPFHEVGLASGEITIRAQDAHDVDLWRQAFAALTTK